MSKIDELWVCTHTKKCRWVGPHSQVNYIRDRQKFWADMNTTIGTCPRCGNREFFVRPILGPVNQVTAVNPVP